MAINIKKIKEAESVLKRCVGKKGMWASLSRYKRQCWTRDLVLAVEDLFLEYGRKDIVKTHLEELAERQRSNGQVPIMFLDGVSRWLLIKIWKSVRARKTSFLLRKFFSKGGVESLSPWTRDSEILFIIGVMLYAEKVGDGEFLLAQKPQVDKALDYIENNLMEGGLARGSDWRDTRVDLDKKFLLTNNCLLYRAYVMLGRNKEADTVKNAINNKFWTGRYYRDYLGADNFDTLGNAFAVLFNIAPPENINSVFAEAEKLRTSFGYKLGDVSFVSQARKEDSEAAKKTNQLGVIWPFIHGFMILAALKAGKNELAEEELEKWSGLEGFYEWYDPSTGGGCGSSGQLWSATMYLKCAAAVYGADSIKI